MPGFTKLFSTLVTSTIWSEDDKTRILWITMLALTDRYGIVGASIPGLAKVAGISTDECRSSLAKLSAPDADSRTKTREGRRIEEADGGWLILNYEKYRKMGRSQSRTEYMREYQRKRRSNKKSQPVTLSTPPPSEMSTIVNPLQPIAEADTGTKKALVKPNGKPTRTGTRFATLASDTERLRQIQGAPSETGNP